MQCPNCNSSWEIPENTHIQVIACPFCKSALTETTQAEPTDNTAEGKIKSIVSHYGTEIYLEAERFKNILADYYGTDKRTIKLFSKVLENQGGVVLFKQKDQNEKDFDNTRRSLIIKVADIEIIAEEHIETAVNLLCVGLGKQVSVIFAPSETTHPQTPVNPSNYSTLFLQNGSTLEKYIGNDTSVIIPDFITEIGVSAFSKCSFLQTITIPHSVTKIADLAFSDCTALQSFTIPNSVTKLGMFVFSGCSSLQSVTLSNSVTTLETYTFGSCSSLKSVTIPSSVVELKSAVFNNCTSLQSVTFLGKKIILGNDTFKGCPVADKI